MKIRFDTLVQIHLPLTKDHLYVLHVLGTAHYDRTCQQFAGGNSTSDPIAGTVGRWRSTLELGGEEVTATIRQIDTARKCLECNGISLSPAEEKLYAEMRHIFTTAFSFANLCYDQWQAVLETDKFDRQDEE